MRKLFHLVGGWVGVGGCLCGVLCQRQRGTQRLSVYAALSLTHSWDSLCLSDIFPYDLHKTSDYRALRLFEQACYMFHLPNHNLY